MVILKAVVLFKLIKIDRENKIQPHTYCTKTKPNKIRHKSHTFTTMPTTKKEILLYKIITLCGV